MPAPTPDLIDFVCRHATVQTNVCTRQRHESGYRLEPRTVADYNLIYLTRGRAVWVIDGAAHELAAGRLAIVPPATHHHAFSRTDAVTILSVHVEATLPGGRDVFEMLTPPAVVDVGPRGHLDRYLRGALAEFTAELPGERAVMMRSWGRLITLGLIRDTATRGLLDYDPLDPLVAELLATLTQRIDRPVTLAELGAWSGYSPQHVNRVFRRTLGVTPLQYLTQLRIERARELLAVGRLTVRAVGERVGFPDPYYFSRTFKQHTGQSPTDYQRSAGADSPSPPS